jgi:hypothetical protein
MWDDNMFQILQRIPSLHSLRLIYSLWEQGGDYILKRLSPRILDNGQIDCLIPKLNAITIQLRCQVVTPNYEALKEVVVSRCSLAHNTKPGDNTFGPIERIREVNVECDYNDYLGSMNKTEWHEEVSEILAPLQEVVDTVQAIIY